MRTITVSTGVFARIWALRSAGEETENEILARILDAEEMELNPEKASGSDGIVGGHRDRRFNVEFPAGFEIFRTYLGTEFSAHSVAQGWTLNKDGGTYRSLNELSKAIGAKIENAWVNWFFRGPDGRKRSVSELRDPKRVVRRMNRRIDTDALLAKL